MNDEAAIVVFGEVLVDQFPDGQRVLGGAPFNVAWHLTALGQKVRFVSAIGDDADGELIRKAMSAWDMDLEALQINREHPTGAVAVTFEGDQPAYDILENRAFDAIESQQLGEGDCALLYHGTLALRAERSRAALAALKQRTATPVFLDVNLRDPWWDPGRVLQLVSESAWVKLNDEELLRLSPAAGDLEDLARDFRRQHHLEGLIVTRGGQGAFALTGTSLSRAAPERTVRVVDTVGAGDAFAAVMLLGIVRRWSPAKSLRRAQEFASLIVQNRGAILDDRSIYEGLAARWQDQDACTSK